MQNKNDIDQLFREGLEGYKVPPPPEVWDKLLAGLDSGKQKKKRTIWIIALTAAASLLFAMMAGWYFTRPALPVHQPMAKQSMQKPAEKSETEMQHPDVNSLPATPNHFSTTSENGKPLHENQTVSIRNAAVLAGDAPSKNSRDRQGNLDKMTTRFIRAFNRPVPEAQLLAMNTGGLSDSDRRIIEENLRLFKQIPEKSDAKRWSVGVEASPAYRFDEQQNQSGDRDIVYGVNQPGNSARYRTTFAGGVKVEYQAGKRLSFRSGVQYSEIAQSNGDVGLSFTGHNWMNGGIGSDEAYYGEPSKNHTATSNQAIINTNIGLANVELPEGAEVAMVSRNTESSFPSEAIQNTRFEQEAGYIEVPLLLRYTLIDQRFGLHLLGGFNTHFLASNQVTLMGPSEPIASGKIEGLNPLTFSSSLGMGFSYTLTERFHLSLEPTMKILLNSLNTQAVYDARPYTLGVYTSISYHF
ncbi:MAG TPA: outer membrane beta-barrel protein [Prolixibacteraceae bacterium]|nr:outer membrane beta-barrel protein [Prolixibacteraceae bacterium]